MSSSIIEIFAARLTIARHAAGLTQEELAARVGLARVSITMMETGRSGTTLDNLTALCRALSASADFLLGLGEFPVAVDQLAELRTEIWRLRRGMHETANHLRQIADSENVDAL